MGIVERTRQKKRERQSLLGLKNLTRPQMLLLSSLMMAMKFCVTEKIHLFGAEHWRYKRGKEVKALDNLGIAICFDTVFPDITRKLAKQGALLVAVPNHDPPVVGFLLHHLHAAFLPIRAIENFVAIVKVDNFGLSQVIAPDGRIIAEAPLGRTTVLKADAVIYPPLQDFSLRPLTPYTLFGDWFVAFCAIMVASLLIWRVIFS